MIDLLFPQRFILNLRSDIDSITKNDIVDACREALNVYNKEHMEQSLLESGNVVYEFEEGMNLEEEEESGSEKPTQIRRRSLKLQDIGGMETIDEEKMETESVNNFWNVRVLNFWLDYFKRSGEGN